MKFQLLHSRVSSILIHNHWTRLERLARDKHSSLLQKFVNYGQKKFYNIGPRADDIKNLRPYFTDVRNWMECSSLSVSLFLMFVGMEKSLP